MATFSENWKSSQHAARAARQAQTTPWQSHGPSTLFVRAAYQCGALVPGMRARDVRYIVLGSETRDTASAWQHAQFRTYTKVRFVLPGGALSEPYLT